MPEQSVAKPKIEEIAGDYLNGENLENLLSFIAWMRENKITPTFANKSKIGVNYTSRVCYLKIRYGSWYFWPAGRNREYLTHFLNNKELNELVVASLELCNGCVHTAKCKGQGQTLLICEKEYKNIRCCCPVSICNPTLKNLELIKKAITKQSKMK